MIGHWLVMRISVLHHGHLLYCDVLHCNILIYNCALSSLGSSHRLSIVCTKPTLTVLKIRWLLARCTASSKVFEVIGHLHRKSLLQRLFALVEATGKYERFGVQASCVDLVDVCVLIFQNHGADAELNSLVIVVQEILYVPCLVQLLKGDIIHSVVQRLLSHVELLLLEKVGVFVGDTEANLIHLRDHVENAGPLIKFALGSCMQLETPLDEIYFESERPVRLLG